MGNSPNQLKRVAYNKGVRLPHVSQRVIDFDAGLPVHCAKHGSHRDWFAFKQPTNGYRNIRCRHCQIDFANSYVERNYLKTLARWTRRRGKETEMDETFLKELLARQGNSCALTGVRFDEEHKPSLDRIDSTKGYTRDNVQLVLSIINRMKTDVHQNTFIAMCTLVAIHAQPLEFKGGQNAA